MPKQKSGQPYDTEGGRVVIQRRLLTSPAYLGLSAQAKALIHLMQVHWRPDRPVAFSVREAMRLIPCCKTKARAAFHELAAAGFIVMMDEYLFCSRTQSKSRTWRLTWMPYNFKNPTNDWEKQAAA